MRKGIVLATLCVALLGASAALQAQETENLIEGFENTLGVFDTADTAGSFTGTDPVHSSDPFEGWTVTQGDYSMGLGVNEGWRQGLQSGYGWQDFFPAMEGATKLRIDVSSSQALSGYLGAGGTFQFALFMQGEIGTADGVIPFGDYVTGTPGHGMGYTYDYLLINSVYSWDEETVTLEWDLTQGGTLNPMPAYSADYGGWFQMRIHTNVSAGQFVDPWVFVDNLRAVVEDGPPQTGLGDFNGDGDVTIGDYTLWADNFGSPRADHFASGSYVEEGDISVGDYTTWADNFGNSYGAMVVPEPATMALLGLGALGLIRRRR